VTTTITEPGETPPVGVPSPDDAKTPRTLGEMPREVAALLISVGVLGVVLPGMAGTPAMIAGGLVIWPKTFGPIEGWFSRKFPKAHRQSLEQIRRYLDDMDRRYPADKPR
jgi:hypothetical protein